MPSLNFVRTVLKPFLGRMPTEYTIVLAMGPCVILIQSERVVYHRSGVDQRAALDEQQVR